MPEFIAYKGQYFTIEWYYNQNEESQSLKYFEELSEIQQERTLMLFKRMGDFGKINNTEKFRYEGNDIFAFKPQPDRFLCFFVTGRKIVVTNGFRKKSRKLPGREKEKAIRYRNDYIERNSAGDYYE